MKGTITVAAVVGAQVSWVDFYVDGNYLASSPPYTYVWGSTTVPNGARQLSVLAKSSNDAALAFESVTVTVANSISPTPHHPTPTATRKGPTPSASKHRPTPTPTRRPTPTATKRPTPSPTHKLGTLPPGSQLPSDAECRTLITQSSWEPRPDNYTANHTMPTASFLSWYRNAVVGGEGGATGSFLRRADGQFTGTTDEILQWAACKWGFDVNTVRATAVNESYWHQDSVGDIGNGVSLGILQVKSSDYPSTCLAVANTGNPANDTNPDCYSHRGTAFDADYKLAQQRACFEGQISYLDGRAQTPGYPDYPKGTVAQMLWGCIGQWYSGGWYDSGAIGYIQQVQQYLSDQTWTQPGF